MTYTETITRGDETTTSVISDASALSVLRRGLRLGATVTADDDGTVTIIRTVLRLAGGNVAESRTVVTLHPDAKAPRLTKTQYEDLKRIQDAGQRARLLPEGRITGAFYSIPPSAAKRLIDRGFVVVIGLERRVEASIAGLLAMTAYEHPAHTTRPRGWHFPDGVCINTTRNHRAHPYQVADFSSRAVCTCGFLVALDRRPYAVSAVRGHLAEQFSAALMAA